MTDADPYGTQKLCDAAIRYAIYETMQDQKKRNGIWKESKDDLDYAYMLATYLRNRLNTKDDHEANEPIVIRPKGVRIPRRRTRRK